jgi:hypothetical protein
MREVYGSDYYVVALDEAKHLVRATRSSKPFLDVGTVSDELERMIAAVRGKIDAASCVLLVDVREGPLRNDPAFENASRPIAELSRSFRRQAVLVKTATGRLQLNRIGRERGNPMSVFEDEAEALAHLLEA